MRVLITGSGGFLGRHFYRAHERNHDWVWGIDDLSSDGATPETVDIVADVLDWFRVADREFDLAYHFAAPVGGRLKIEGDPLFNAHSLALDEAFFRWAIKYTKRAVYPSSSAVYGVEHQSIEGMAALPESLFDPTADRWSRPDEMYGFTKMAGEVLAHKARQYGLHTLCIRPFSGYGEGQSFEYPVPSIAARALREEDPLTIWGSGRQARDFIHVDDIVRLTMAALETEHTAINLGSGVATTFRYVAALYAALIGYDPEIVTDETKPEGVKTRWADISKQAALSDQPLISIQDGLSRVLEDVQQRLVAAS